MNIPYQTPLPPASVPLVAWEQMGVVVLFAVMIVIFATGVFAFIQFMLSWATKREAQWQEFIRDLRNEDRAERLVDSTRTDTVLADTRDVLAAMAKTLQAIIDDLKEHDLQAKEIKKTVGAIEQNTRPLPGEPGFVERRKR